jgi:cytochrome c biogenesis protein CcdA
VHFIALFLPFFSGYSIASGRHVKGLWASIEIGFIMGLTLGSTILGIGILAIAVLSWLEHRVNMVYVAVVIGVSCAISSYTAIAACIGALWAAYQRDSSAGESGGRG